MYTYMSVWTHLYPSAMSSNDDVQQVQIYIFSIDFRIFLERSPEIYDVKFTICVKKTNDIIEKCDIYRVQK